MLNTLGKQYPCVCLFAFLCVCIYGCGFIIMTDSLYTESIRMKKKIIIDSKFVNQFLFLLIQSLFVCWSSHIMNTFEGLLSLWWRWWLLQLSLIFTNFFLFCSPDSAFHATSIMDIYWWWHVFESQQKKNTIVDHHHHHHTSFIITATYILEEKKRKKKFETVNNHKRDSISLQLLLLWLFMIEIDIEENRLFLSLDADLFRILFFLFFWWPFYFILLSLSLSLSHTHKQTKLI